MAAATRDELNAGHGISRLGAFPLVNAPAREWPCPPCGFRVRAAADNPAAQAGNRRAAAPHVSQNEA
ncbi:hypothetical protein GCM10010094_24470 [Streptomyces flaveus]|uniref:Uncharacterized protein n=1 Tax=Streptomyces flaveus TaxID=66370 RepID=A0A917QQY8_9ACTN|nr:hypothetical protein GCM10010094_24470 [Streptomyces flaveus]